MVVDLPLQADRRATDRRQQDAQTQVELEAQIHRRSLPPPARTIGPMSTTRPLLPAGSATWADFERLDLRVGRIVAAEPFPEARRAAYRLTIDLGPGGLRRSSAQLPGTYADPGALVGRLVVVVANFAPKRIAGFSSEVLVLGALPVDGRMPLLSVDEGAAPGESVA